MTDRLLERLCAIGIGIAPDFPAGEILVDRELVLEAIRRIKAQNAEIERLRALITAWADACRAPDCGVCDPEWVWEAEMALRKAVGR